MHHSSSLRTIETEAELRNFLENSDYEDPQSEDWLNLCGQLELPPNIPEQFFYTSLVSPFSCTQCHRFPKVLCSISAVFTQLMTTSFPQRRQRFLDGNSLNFFSNHLQIGHIHIQSCFLFISSEIGSINNVIFPYTYIYIVIKRLRTQSASTRLSFFLLGITRLPEEYIPMDSVFLPISLLQYGFSPITIKMFL